MIQRCLILLSAAALCGCSGVSKATAKVDHPREAVRVLAGDSLVVHGERILLVNATAPALPPAAHCWGEAALAVQAAAKTQALVAGAEAVAIAREGHDPEGRTLARITLDGRRDLGEALVFAGVASRRGSRTLDWCGPADFHALDGPAFDTGPQANADFMAWADAEQARRVNESMVRMMIEADPPLDMVEGY